MALPPGTRLGPYQILDLIGAGGMGEVYRGKDTRLDRDVAIKVLPAHLAANAEFRQRLEREARAVAALNHPHICALYDIGSHRPEGGSQEAGVDFLVLEYLEGATLAARLEKGPLPVDQALRCAIQVADALDKAHRKGFTHRDLKPGNIMLTKSGAKLLDFGLAKAAATAAPAVNLSAMPTEGAPLTVAGAILGTIQYMSPEQVEGRDADARSDIFAFGAVLYEMTTGKKAFPGKSHTSVIAAILDADPPPIQTVQPASPAALERAVRTCLAKDPDQRWQSAHDLMRELEWIAEGDAAAPAHRRVAHPRVAGAVAAVATLIAMLLAVAYFRRPAMEAPVLKLSVLPPEKASFGDPVVISPDGRRLVFAAAVEGRSQLWVRSLDSLSPQPLPGTGGGIFPFWSPDSRYLGFFAEGKLRRIEVSGGPPQTLCDAFLGTGGAWNRDGVILFAPNRTGPLMRVSAAGGQAAPFTTLDPSVQETGHRWPLFLPDGKHYLYIGRGPQAEHHAVYAASLDSKNRKRLLAAESMVAYAPPHGDRQALLLFVRQGSLMAQPFDAGGLELRGEARPIAERVAPGLQFGFHAFSVSDNGVLAYRTGSSAAVQPTWFDRSGKLLGPVGQPGLVLNVSLSPDGKRIAETRGDPGGGLDIWLRDVARGAASRFTFEPTQERFPVWSPDGSRIAYASDREGVTNLYQKSSSGAGTEELLLKTPEQKYPSDWSADGRFLLFDTVGTKTARDLWLLPLTGDRAQRAPPVPFLQTPFSELQGQFSPGPEGAPRWIAYTSNETLREEVFVQTFPASGAKWMVSTNGGREPRWRRDGKELFYLAPDRKLMSVDVKLGATFEAGVPRALFEIRPPSVSLSSNYYAVTADGQRFLVAQLAEESAGAPITVVMNWK